MWMVAALTERRSPVRQALTMRGGITQVVGLGLGLLLAHGSARAEEHLANVPVPLIDRGLRLEDAWPAPPPSPSLALDQQLVDRMTELGNRAAAHLDVLTRDAVGLRIDGRHQRAHLRLAGGAARYLTFFLNEDIHIADGKARVASVVDIGVYGHSVHLELPAVEMAPTNIFYK